MDSDEEEKFFSDPGGLGLPPEIAKWLASTVAKLCPVLGIAAGIAVASGGFSAQGSIAANAGVRRDPRIGLALILGGIGIGLITVGGACTAVKSRLREYTSQFADAKSAISGLKPQVRTALRLEAEKLIRIKSQLDEALQEPPDPRYSA